MGEPTVFHMSCWAFAVQLLLTQTMAAISTGLIVLTGAVSILGDRLVGLRRLASM